MLSAGGFSSKVAASKCKCLVPFSSSQWALAKTDLTRNTMQAAHTISHKYLQKEDRTSLTALRLWEEGREPGRNPWSYGRTWEVYTERPLAWNRTSHPKCKFPHCGIENGLLLNKERNKERKKDAKQQTVQTHLHGPPPSSAFSTAPTSPRRCWYLWWSRASFLLCIWSVHAAAASTIISV